MLTQRDCHDPDAAGTWLARAGGAGCESHVRAAAQPPAALVRLGRAPRATARVGRAVRDAVQGTWRAYQQTYVGRIARIYELAVLLSRTPADASARSTDAALTHDMQAFMQGLDDSEQVLLTAGRAATRTMQEFLAGSD